MGIGPKALGPDAHLFQQAFSTVFPLLIPHRWPVSGEGIEEVATHGHQWIEPSHRVLKHQAYRFPAQGA